MKGEAPKPPRDGSISLVGGMLCGMIVIGGLTLTAMAMSKRGYYTEAAILALGPLVTFAAATFISEADYRIRFGWYRLRFNLHYKGVANPPQMEPEGAGASMEFVRKLAIPLLGIVAINVIIAAIYSLIK